MAGVKGRSGGARPNSGPKPKPPPEPVLAPEDDPLEFLKRVMRGEINPTPLQVRSAIAAAQYVHTKKHDGGKKDEQIEKAQKAGKKFAPSVAPKLVVNNGG